MKFFIQVILILIIFFKTGNLLSDNNLFSVNNIILEKKGNNSTNQLANQAIKKGFDQLIQKILMKEDISKVANLKYSDIKNLVTYYNILKNTQDNNNKINFSVTFDKDKMHDLFYKKGISYSDIDDKEFYILPIFLDGNEANVFSNNFYYENWNNNEKDEIVEFILPLENIEIIENINQNIKNLLDLNLNFIFKEYSKKNVGIALVESSKLNEKKSYIKLKIHNKTISKNLIFNNKDMNETQFNEKVINGIKDEIINLIKSQNLIDIRTPSFINVKFNLNENNNLVILNEKIKKIDLIENVFVQDFNKDYVNLKVKYLGNLEKIINQLNSININLLIRNEQWIIEIF